MSKLQLNTFIDDMVSPCPKVGHPRANKAKAQGIMGSTGKRESDCALIRKATGNRKSGI